MDEKAWGHWNGMFWRMGRLFPGPIWREFQTPRILPDSPCLLLGPANLRGKASGRHFCDKSKQPLAHTD